MNIFMLVDGLAEDPKRGQTSLELGNYSSLDKLCGLQNFGLYEPSCRPNVPNPETYVIFPYFFGLKPENNPGRAGLELFGAGISITDFPVASIFRVIQKNYDVRNGWDAVPKALDEVLINALIDKVDSAFKNVKTMKSVISRKGNVWCVGSRDKETYEDYINTLQFEASQHNLNVYPVVYEIYHPITESVRIPTGIHGWVVGSLLDGLRLIGVEDLQSYALREMDLFNYGRKMSDFENHVIPSLKSRLNRNCSSLLYVKEPSAAARKKTRNDKMDSIAFVDGLMGRIFDEFEGQDVNFAFLVDHQSNMGEERTFKGGTLYAVGNLADLSDLKLKFTEQNAVLRAPRKIDQPELIKIIENTFEKYRRTI